MSRARISDSRVARGAELALNSRSIDWPPVFSASSGPALGDAADSATPEAGADRAGRRSRAMSTIIGV